MPRDKISEAVDQRIKGLNRQCEERWSSSRDGAAGIYLSWNS